MIKLKLPKTISLAAINDMPQNEDAILRLQQVQNNNIVEGYTFIENEDEKYPYKFYAEINIDNDRLWSLFKTLMMSMPEYQSLLTGHKDDNNNEVVCNDYTDKYTIYNRIEKYEKELTLDGFLQFGVIHQADDYMEEVFVCSPKYIQYWGMNVEHFMKVVDSYWLHEVENLEFIDSYPMVTKSLSYIDADALPTDEILKALREDN